MVYQLVVGYYVTRSVQVVGFFHLAARLRLRDGPIAALAQSGSIVGLIYAADYDTEFNDYKSQYRLASAIKSSTKIETRHTGNCVFSVFHGVRLRAREDALCKCSRLFATTTRVAAEAPPRTHNLQQHRHQIQVGLAVASIARDDPSTLPGDDPFSRARMHRDRSAR